MNWLQRESGSEVSGLFYSGTTHVRAVIAVSHAEMCSAVRRDVYMVLLRQ